MYLLDWYLLGEDRKPQGILIQEYNCVRQPILWLGKAVRILYVV